MVVLTHLDNVLFFLMLVDVSFKSLFTSIYCLIKLFGNGHSNNNRLDETISYFWLI